MSKTIIFCADGTWCGPGNAGEGLPGQSNVFKLFNTLKKNTPSDSLNKSERTITFGPPHSQPLQMAMYIHGVGDGEGWIAKHLDGTFGLGVTTRIARGYAYISSHYQPEDRIVIIGFSRGAYTARALADMIATQGLLKPDLANGDKRYDNAVEAWLRYRRASSTSWSGKVTNVLSQLDNISAYVGADPLDVNSFVCVDSIAAVAVWDTVGSVGIPVEGFGVDVAGYDDNTLSLKVQVGLHAVSLDEQRKSFIPTLWTAASNVTQKIFPGGHTDIGGGNSTSGLSDGPLKWFVDSLAATEIGLQFEPYVITPNAEGPETRKWEAIPWDFPEACATRDFSEQYHMLVDQSVYDRKAASKLGPTTYDPSNLPKQPNSVVTEAA